MTEQCSECLGYHGQAKPCPPRKEIRLPDACEKCGSNWTTERQRETIREINRKTYARLCTENASLVAKVAEMEKVVEAAKETCDCRNAYESERHEGNCHVKIALSRLAAPSDEARLREAVVIWVSMMPLHQMINAQENSMFESELVELNKRLMKYDAALTKTDAKEER